MTSRLLALLFAIALPSLSSAATINWTGASDTNWFNAANWSPAQIPASSDDVLIDANKTVIVSAGSPSISFNTLTLGNAAGSTAPALILSASVATSGILTINPRAVLQQNTTLPLGFASVTVLPGGMITHGANGSTRNFIVNLDVSGDFDLRAGGHDCGGRPGLRRHAC